MLNLGIAYANGQGVERDHSAAIRHLSEAKQNGSEEAQGVIDQILKIRRETEANAKERTAARVARRAAQRKTITMIVAVLSVIITIVAILVAFFQKQKEIPLNDAAAAGGGGGGGGGGGVGSGAVRDAAVAGAGAGAGAGGGGRKGLFGFGRRGSN